MRGAAQACEGGSSRIGQGGTADIKVRQVSGEEAQLQERSGQVPSLLLNRRQAGFLPENGAA